MLPFYAYRCGMATILANPCGTISDMTKPSRELTRAVAKHRRAEEQLDQARAELHAAIVADLEAGVRQADLVRATGYTRETLRRVAREAGLTAASYAAVTGQLLAAALVIACFG